MRGKKLIVNLIVLLFMICFIAYKWNVDNLNKNLASQNVTLTKCIDGDTAKFKIHDDQVKSVRFLSIDTPETVKPNIRGEPYAKEASEYTCKILTNAKEIRLEFEDNNKIDKYDRLLAWVFADDELLQSKLVREGLAEIRYEQPDYKYLSILKIDQVQAKQQNKGLWSED